MANKAKNLKKGLHLSEEEVSFIINANNSSISVSNLIDYLENYENLIRSINYCFNREYSVGYDIINIEIQAFNKGSFEIKSVLKKYGERAIELLLGALITGIFENKQQEVTINITECENVTINTTTFNNDPSIIKQRSNIARTACQDSNVSGITFKYMDSMGEKTEDSVSKETLNTIIVDDIDENTKESQWLHNASFIIISPVLESEPANWKIKGTGKAFSAEMTDLVFLKKMDEEKIAFGKGDYIKADLETIITKKEEGKPTVKHYIRKVHDYPHYSNQISPSLF